MNELVIRAKQGDSDAFVELFERHKLALWKAAMAVLDNADDAADALQETAVKAWKAIPLFEGRSAVGTWLTRILLRTCSDVARRRRRETPCSMDDGFFSEAFGAAGEERGFNGRNAVGSVSAVDHDIVLDVRGAVDRLSADDRLLLTFFYVGDYPTRHIAEILNVSEGAVRTRLSRARDRFKALYLGKRQEEVEAV